MASDRALELLASIDASLKQLVAQKRASEPKPVASDRDLDGQYGNPIVKFMPRDWTGPSFKSRPLSDCPPELLDMLANTFEYFAEQAEQKNERTNSGKPVADFKRQDAARARGWAKRIREGRHVQRHDAAPAAEGWPEIDSDGWDATH